MAGEFNAASAYLGGRLASDSVLVGRVGDRIFNGEAPQIDETTGQPPQYPMVVFTKDGEPVYTRAPGGEVLMCQWVFLVRAIGTEGYEDLQVEETRLLAALFSQEGSAIRVGGADFWILGCVLDAGYADDGVVNGVRFYDLGGKYRVIVKPL